MSNVSLINGHDDEVTRCERYCGVACVNGYCPQANREECAERGYDIVHNCNECHYYKGCEDCCFEGDLDCCPKERRGKEE